MKILVVHNKYQYRGGENSVFKAQIKLLQKNGEQVDTLTFDNRKIVSSFDKFKYGFYSFYNPVASNQLKQKIKKFCPDIIHVHNFFPIASPSLFFTAQRLDIPIIMTLHNYRLICPNAILFRNEAICEFCIDKSFPYSGVIHGCYHNSKIETFFLALMFWLHKNLGTWHYAVDHYIALSNFAKNKFVHSSLQLSEDKITVKSNFLEDHGFDIEKDDYCLFVGRLSEEKGIEILLESFTISGKQLHIIGYGPLEHKVKFYMKSHDNIFYHGFKSIDFILEKLKKAKALIFTSKLYEGMPMTILEAFSTGTPVICGNIGTPAEMVKDGVNGLTYEVGQSQELQKKVDWLYAHPDEALELCRNARSEYEKHYSEKRNYQQLIKIYKDVIYEKKKSHIH